MADVVSTINVTSQIGQEATPGAGGAAGTKLQTLKIEPGDELTIKQIMALGHRFDTATVVNQQWSSFGLSADELSYTEHLYALDNIFGAAAPSVPSGAVATQKRVWTPPPTGAITPKTWTQQFGDSVDNVNSYAYGLLTDYGEKYDREAGVTPSGSGVAQKIATGATFTGAPRVLALVPVGAADVNYYLDTAASSLGSTQITDEINTCEWSLKGMKQMRWASDRAQASFKSHTDLAPKTEVKFTLFEGVTARAIITSLRKGTTYFLRIDAQSATLTDNLYVVTISGGPTGGTFTLTYKGQTTSPGIAFNATAAAVQTALGTLSSIGAGNVAVTGATGGPYTVQFKGTLAQDTSALTASGAALTGGTSPNATSLAQPFFYLSQRDIAFKLTKLAAYKDEHGIYAREVTGTIVEDATWGKALVATSQTVEATL